MNIDNLSKRTPIQFKRSVDAIRADLEREPMTEMVTTVCETQTSQYIQFIGPTALVEENLDRYLARWDEILYGVYVLRHVTMGPHTVVLVTRRLEEF